MSEIPWTTERIHRWFKVLIPVILVLAVFWAWGERILSVAAPFLVAFLLAYVFNPVVTFLEGRTRKEYRMRRVLAVGLVYIGFIILAAVLCLILAEVVEELALFGQKLPHYGANLYKLVEKNLLTQLDRMPPEMIEEVKEQLQPENLKILFYEYIMPRLKEADVEGVGTAVRGMTGFLRIAFGLMMDASAKILGGAGSVASFLFSLSLVVVISFYLLLDYDRFLKKLSRCIPNLYRDDAMRVFSRIDQQLSGFLRGQILICICVGTLVAVGLSLIGVEYALVIGMAAGVLNIIPYLGPGIGAVLSVGVSFLDRYEGAETDWRGLLVQLGSVAAVFFAIQTLDAFFLSPKIMGDKLDLHPMIILFALLLGGALFGVVGMLIAVPIACMVRVLIEEIYFADPRRSATT